MSIRAYQPSDLPALYRICLATGDAGADASMLYRDPLLVGHVYAAPYAILSPQTCFVAEDEGDVCGYIVGACDTAEFEARLETDWWPELRRLYPAPAVTEGELRTDQLMLHLIHHPFRTPSRFTASHPSHLHINLLSRAQRKGVGKQLIGTWLSEMWKLGSRGAHLAVGIGNPNAIAFYRRYGFDELERTGRDGRIVWFGTRPEEKFPPSS
jgi:GNAT superfamily N-acetyltransferase